MNLRLSTSAVCLTVLASFVLGVSDGQAGFADNRVGARGLSMGGAFVAVEGDPASLFWNPAAIRPGRSVEVSGMRTRLYDGVDGLTEDFLGLTAEIGEDLAIGAGWTRTGLEDLYHEDVLTGALAWRVPGLPLSVGGSVLFYGASAPGYEELNDPNYLGAQWETSFSLGLLYDLGENFHLGISLENLLRPEMALLGNTTDIDQIGGRRRFGVSYLLQELVWLSGELRHEDFPDYYDSEWTLHAGAESWFNDILALRVGIDDGDLTAGAGLVVHRVRFDGGLVTNERLGNTFRAAVTLGY